MVNNPLHFILGPSQRLLSFNAYKQRKGKEWKNKVSGKKSKREDVVISLGLLEWKDGRDFKQRRGKRTVVRVNTEDNYHVLLRKCEEKWKAYHEDLHDVSET